MRRYLVVAACAMAVLVGASTASAFITNPQAPGNWGTLTSCNPSGGTVIVASGDPFDTGDYLRLGWGSITEAQSYNFLAAQSGTLSITGENGTQSWTWGVGDTDDWTLPALMSAPGNSLNGGKPLWQTFSFFQVNLPPGTYTIDASFQVSKTVNNGATVFKAGTTWFSTAGCMLTIA